MIEKILEYIENHIQYGSSLILKDLSRGGSKVYAIDNLSVSVAEKVPIGAIFHNRISLGKEKNEIICIFESANVAKKKAFIPEMYIQIYTKTSPPIEEVYLIKEKKK